MPDLVGQDNRRMHVDSQCNTVICHRGLRDESMSAEILSNGHNCTKITSSATAEGQDPMLENSCYMFHEVRELKGFKQRK